MKIAVLGPATPASTAIIEHFGGTDEIVRYNRTVDDDDLLEAPDLVVYEGPWTSEDEAALARAAHFEIGSRFPSSTVIRYCVKEHGGFMAFMEQPTACEKLQGNEMFRVMKGVEDAITKAE